MGWKAGRSSRSDRACRLVSARPAVRLGLVAPGIGRLDAAFQPLALARWETRTRYGETEAEQRVARAAWESPALGFMRWFADQPAFDGLSAGSTCAWFLDLRFLNPGRDWLPFRYGACREGPGEPWRAFERTGDASRRPVD